jgi:hypothetical protein
MNAVIARLRAAWAWIVTWAWEWPQARLDGLTLLQWRSQRRRAEEAMIEAETVDRALALDTPEADIQLAGQRAAFVRQIDALREQEWVRALTRPENLQLFHLSAALKRIDARMFGAPILERRLAEFGEVGERRGFMGALAGAPLMQWIAMGAAALALTGWGAAWVQGQRAERFEHQRDEARAVSARNEAAARAWRAEYEQSHAQVIAASAQAAESARREAEARARAARAARREQERQRAIQNVLIRDEPPAWRLRDAEPADGSPSAGGSDPAAGDPG